MNRALEDIVKQSIDETCPTFTLSHLESKIEAHLFFTRGTTSTADGVVMLGLLASTRALVHCPGGLVSVYLSSENSGSAFDSDERSIQTIVGVPPPATFMALKYRWPLDQFLTNAGKTLVRSVPIRNRGFLGGNLRTVDDIFTLREVDIFSPYRGGVMIKDTALDVASETALTTLFNRLITITKTEIPVLDDQLSLLFDMETCLSSYKAQTLVPTYYGFLQYAEKLWQGRVSFYMNPTLDGAHLSISYASLSGPTTYKDPLFAKINSALTSFADNLLATESGLPTSKPQFDAGTEMNATSHVAYLAFVDVDWSTPLLPQALLVSKQVGGSLSVSTTSFSGIFTCADVLASYDESIVDLKCCVPSKGVVSNKFTRNDVWATNVIDAYQKTYDVILSGWSSGGILSPFDFSAGHITGYGEKTYYGLALALQNAVVLSFGSTLENLVNNLEETIRNYTKGEDVIVVPSFAPTTTSLNFSIKFIRLGKTYATSFAAMDMSALAIPLLVETDLSFNIVNNVNASTIDLSISASVELRDWVAPLVDGMDAAIIGSNVLNIDISLPGDASLVIALDAKTHYFGDITANFAVTDISTSTSETLEVLDGEPSRYQQIMSPNSLLSTLTMSSRLAPKALSNTLNFTVPIVGNIYPSSTVEQFIGQLTPWLSTASADYVQLFKTTSICDTTYSSTSFGWTVNGADLKNCTLSTLSLPFDITTLATKWTTDLANCGFGELIKVVFEEDPEQESGEDVGDESPNCGIFGFYPVAPGIVLSVTIDQWTTQIFVEPAKFTMTVMPNFHIWEDLAWLNFNLFRGSPDELPDFPERTTISVNDFDVISFELQDVYAHEQVATTLPFRFSFSNNITNFQNQVSGVSFLGSSVVADFNVTSNGNITTSLDFTLVFARTGLPVSESFAIFSNVNSPSTIDSPIESDTPLNFTLNIAGEKRSSTSVENFSASYFVTLTPGLSILEGLREGILAVLPDDLGQMMNISKYEYQAITETAPQVSIGVSRVLIGDTWFIPWSIGISNVNVGFLSNSHLEPSRGLVLAKDYSHKVDLSVVPTIPKVNGTLGLIPFLSSQVDSVINVQLEVVSKNEFTFLTGVSAVVDNRDAFFEYLDLVMYGQSHLTVSNITFPSSLGAVPSASFTAVANFENSSLTDLTMLDNVQSIIALDILPESLSPKMTSLTKISKTSLCQILANVDQLAAALRTMPGANQKLPLVSDSFNNILGTKFDTYLSRASSQFCGVKQYDIPTFCDRLQSTFGATSVPCQQLSLSSTNVTLPIDMVIPFQKPTTFSFDTATFLSDVLPVGLGPLHGVQVFGEARVKALFVMNLDGTPGQFSMFPGSTMEIAPAYNLSNSVQTELGALSITFSAVNGSMTSSALATFVKSLDGEPIIDVVVNGTAFMKSKIRFPGVDLCGLDVKVDNLETFLTNSLDSSFRVKADCSTGNELLSVLNTTFSDVSIYGFLTNSPAILGYVRREFREITDTLFSNSGTIGKFEVPLLGNKLQLSLGGKIANITSPEFFKKFSSLVNDSSIKAAANITYIENGKNLTRFPTRKEKDDKMIKEYTEILCNVFSIKKCPNSTQDSEGGDEVFSWPIPLDLTYKFNASTVDFPIGKNFHFAGSFEMPSTIIGVEAELNFVISYSKAKGIKFGLSNTTVFKLWTFAEMTNVTLKGKIGYLGAQLKANVHLGFGLQYVRHNGTSLFFEANMMATADLGAVSVNADGTPDFNSLPRFTATMEVGWGNNTQVTISKKVSQPDFALKKVGMCFGTMVKGPVLRFVNSTLKWLEPMNKFIGPDGLLQKVIPGTERIFGKTLKVIHVLEQLAVTLCDSGCQWTNVFELLETYADVVKQAKLFLNADDGCAVTVPGSSFRMNFMNHTWPTLNITDKATENFEGHPTQIAKATSFKKGWEGKWGIKVRLIEDIPDKIVSLMQGKPIEIVGITFPKFVVSAGVQFDVPLYSPPSIMLHIEASAKLILDIGELVFTSRGITDVMRTKNPLLISNSFALRVKNQDGSPHYFVGIELSLGAGVRLDLFVLDVTATVSISIKCQFAFKTLHDDALMTFGEFSYQLIQVKGDLTKILLMRITARASFSFKIRACIPMGFAKICVSLLKFEIGATLFDIIIEPGFKAKPVFLPGGIVSVTNVGLSEGGAEYVKRYLSDGSELPEMTRIVPERILPEAGATSLRRAILATQEIFDNDARRVITMYDGDAEGEVVCDFSVGGDSPVSRSMIPPGPVNLDGASDSPYTLQILNLGGQVNIPASSASLVNVEVFQEDMAEASSFFVTSGLVRSDVSLGVFTQTCKLLNLTKPLAGAEMEITGCPCLTAIEASMATVSLSGNPGDYRQPIFVTGTTNTIESTVTSTEFTISDTKIVGNGGYEVEFPQPPLLTVSGHPVSDTTFEITSVHSQLDVYGGEGNDFFTLPNFSFMKGIPMLSGGGGLNGWKMALDAQNGASTLLRGTSLIQNSDNGLEPRMAQWSNIQQMDLEYTAAPTGLTELEIVSIQSNAFLTVTMIGNPTSTTEQRVRGCENQAEVRIYLVGGGHNNVILETSDQDITSFRCTIRVYGNADTDQGWKDTITIVAPKEQMSTQWVFDAETLTVRDLQNKNNWFQLIYTDIEFLDISYGEGGSNVEFARGSAGAEYRMNFPTPIIIPNTATIFSSVGTILLMGEVSTVQLGATPDPVTPNIPFNLLRGITGIYSTTPIDIKMASGQKVDPQYMALGAQCFNQVTRDEAVIARLNGPSDWMCTILQDVLQNPDVCSCTVGYKANIKNLAIGTGEGSDRVLVNNVTVSNLFDLQMSQGANYFDGTGSTIGTLNVDTGASQDYFSLTKSVLDFLSIDLGDGKDTAYIGDIQNGGATIVMGYESDILNFEAPLGNMDIWLGKLDTGDNSIDSVYINSTLDTSLSRTTGGQLQASPIGPANEALIFRDYDIEDLLFINDNVDPSEDDSTHVRIEIVGTVKKGMTSNTTYDIAACDLQGVLELNGLNDLADPSAGSSASNWHVAVMLPRYDKACLIRIYSTIESKGVVSILIPEGEIYDVQTKSTESQGKFGVTRTGQVTIETMAVSNIEIRALGALDMYVNGIASNADLLVTAVTTSPIEIVNLQSNLITINLDVTLPHPSLLSNLTIVTQGLRTFTTFNELKGTALREVTQINYNDGCITTEPSSGASTPSERFMKQLQDYSLPLNSVSCFAYTHNIRGLAMNLPDTTQVSITGIPKMAPRLQFTGGLVTLEDPEVWSSANLTGRVLIVDKQRYQVTLYRSEFTVSSNVWSPETKFDLTTSVSAPYAKWFLGGDVATGLTWDGITSIGSLRFSPDSIPTVDFHGQGSEFLVDFGSEKGSARFVPSEVETYSNVSFTSTTLRVHGEGSIEVVDFDLWGAGKINMQGYEDDESYFIMEPHSIMAAGLSGVAVNHTGPLLELISSFGRGAKFNMSLDTGIMVLTNTNEIHSADFMYDTELVHTSVSGKSSLITFNARRGTVSLDNIVRFYTTTRETNHSLATTNVPAPVQVNYATGVITLGGVLTLDTNINATDGLLKVNSDGTTPVPAELNLNTAYLYLGGTENLSVNFDGRTNQFQIDSVHSGKSVCEIVPQAGTATLEGVQALSGKFNSEETNMVFESETLASTADIDLKEGRLELSSALRIDVAASSIIGNMTVVAYDTDPFPTITAAKTGYVYVERSEELEAYFNSENVTIQIHSFSTTGADMISELELSTGIITISGMRSLEYNLDHPTENNTLAVQADGSNMALEGDMHEGLTNISRSEHIRLVKQYPHYQLNMNATSDSQVMKLFSSSLYDMLKSATFAEAAFATEDTSLSLTCVGKLSLVNISKDSDLEIVGEAIFSGIKSTPKGTMDINSTQPLTGRLFITDHAIDISRASQADINMTMVSMGQILISGEGKYLSAELDVEQGIMNFGGRGILNISMDVNANMETKRMEDVRNITVTEYDVTMTGLKPLAIKQADAESNVLFTSLELTLRDGPNDIHVLGSLLPKLFLDEGVGVKISSATSATMLTFPNAAMTFNIDEMALHLEESESQACISPKEGCSMAAWTSLSGGKYTNAPCHSTFYPCPELKSIELNFYGKVQCISPDRSVEGWEISTVEESVDEYQDLFRPSLKGFIIFVYTLDILMLILGWVVFGSIMIEGWVAFAISAFLMKTTPQNEEVSMLALNLVFEAYHVFVGWFMGEGCSIHEMRGGWALIAITLIIWVIAIVQRQKWLQSYAVLDIVKRTLIIFGFFFLSPTALSHLPLESSTMGAMISTILIICVTSLAFSFVYDSFFLPAWLAERVKSHPAFSFALWPRSVYSYATLVFLCLALITPGACLHNSFDRQHTVGVAITLILIFAGFTLLKEFVILKRHKSKAQTIAVVSLVVLTLIFSFIFVGIYNTAAKVSALFVVCWVIWAFIIPSLFVANEASHYYWAKTDEKNIAHADGDL
eukprot:TRINITY_DN600_c0_g2_i1.p1 TRINITY_DN600_c0_g2~~TRINITY_DN600_c0_g2_i1.p1  ORF type:complete len:4697 (+),score=803.54 TRINITY_DN600_c0_g2_i1:784-14091(+)